MLCPVKYLQCSVQHLQCTVQYLQCSVHYLHRTPLPPVERQERQEQPEAAQRLDTLLAEVTRCLEEVIQSSSPQSSSSRLGDAETVTM